MNLKSWIFQKIPPNLYPLSVVPFYKLHPSYANLSIKSESGVYWVIEENDKICIPSLRRITVYRKGIKSRLNEIQKKYFHYPEVIVKEEDTVIDVGAYIGGFTLSISEVAKNVIAFEPDNNSFKCLERNTRKLENVQIKNTLLWKANEEVEFEICPEKADSSAINIDSGKTSEKTVLEGIKMKDELSKLEIDKVDFLKMDAEGAEREVLEGLESKIKKINKVAIDCGPERFGNTTHAEVLNLLKKNGFKTIKDQHMVYGWKSR